MSAKDRFSRKLRCPVCGREGLAEMWEEEGYSYAFGDQATHIDSLTDGFRTVNAPSSIRADLDFQCIDHQVSAVA